MHDRTPRTRPPRQRRSGAVALALTFMLSVLAFSTPTTAVAAPDSASSSSGEARLAAKRPAPKTVLQRNPLYRAGTMRDVGCAPASQQPLDTTAGLGAYYRSVMPCLNRAWKSEWKKVAKTGAKFKAPKLVMHSGRPSSPCANTGPLSFYCPLNQTIYMYDAEIVNPWNAYPNDEWSHGLTRLAGTHTLAHEYGHHVQELVGVIRAIRYRYDGNPGRQLELQASCLGNVWLSAQASAYPIAEDYAARGDLWRYIQVSNHGSIANQKTWTDRGYASANPRSCNTFTAPARLTS